MVREVEGMSSSSGRLGSVSLLPDTEMGITGLTQTAEYLMNG